MSLLAAPQTSFDAGEAGGGARGADGDPRGCALGADHHDLRFASQALLKALRCLQPPALCGRAEAQLVPLIGINITKSTAAKGFSKIVPVIGGFVSSGLTFMALQSQSALLKEHLREIPPPGVDVDEWDRHRLGATRQGQTPETATTIKKGLRGKAKVVMVGAKSAASGIADGASSLSGGLKGRLGRRK